MWRRWLGAAVGFCFFLGTSFNLDFFFSAQHLLLNDMFEIYRWFVENIEDWGCWRMLSDITIWGNCHRLFVQKRPSLLFFGGNDQPQRVFWGWWKLAWILTPCYQILGSNLCFFGIWEPCHQQWLNNVVGIQGSKLPTDLCCCGRWIFATFWSCYLDCWGEESREDPNF